MIIHKYLNHEVFCLDDVPNNIKSYFGPSHENRCLFEVYGEDMKLIYGWVIKEVDSKDKLKVDYNVFAKNQDKVRYNVLNQLIERGDIS